MKTYEMKLVPTARGDLVYCTEAIEEADRAYAAGLLAGLEEAAQICEARAALPRIRLYTGEAEAGNCADAIREQKVKREEAA